MFHIFREYSEDNSCEPVEYGVAAWFVEDYQPKWCELCDMGMCKQRLEIGIGFSEPVVIHGMAGRA